MIDHVGNISALDTIQISSSIPPTPSPLVAELISIIPDIPTIQTHFSLITDGIHMVQPTIGTISFKFWKKSHDVARLKVPS